jgi:hypothetical protein
VGCGVELLYSRAVALGLPIESWLIVEPSTAFADGARRAATDAIQLRVVEAFFEDVAAQLASSEERVDVLLMSGLLQELQDPDGAIELARQVLRGAGIFHVTVANAGSLHRRLARSMRLISSLDELSERNVALAQPRVYDRASIRQAIEKGGFEVVEEGGYFLKPFTNDQMTSVTDALPDGVTEGLMQLGRELPDLASEIFVNARPSNGP